jgi:hypothetical protein
VRLTHRRLCINVLPFLLAYALIDVGYSAIAQTTSPPAPVRAPASASAPAPAPVPPAPLAAISITDPPNGISVGKPKVFDNRTLTLMLESLSQTLQSMQAQFVDQKSLTAALGNFQGFRSTETSSNFAINTLPIPGVTKEVVANAGNVDTSGKALPDTSKTTTTTTQTGFTPQPPALDTAPAFPGFNPNYGESSSDLFSDQVNLSYQIFNLRMILERSLSDRLQGNDTRLQAVLGFNVTVDPPRTANDAVAVVEITLKATAGGDLSLVALMPQEKTYNSAALSTKSNAFSGSAVLKVVQVGYSQRRRGQTFYLYRDNDTVSYERMDSTHPDQIVFGWMFRPVLGRRSVSPGMRQLFAVASLPAADNCTPETAIQHACPVQQLSAHVRTFWKKYDSGTLTSFERRDTNRAARVKHGFTFGLTIPELFEARYLNEADYTNVAVRTTAAYQQDLGPTISQASWVSTGPKTALISVTGNNFFTGTQVALGDKAYASVADGLILKSNQAFDLSTTLDSLASGNAAVIGRYGIATPLLVSSGIATAGVQIDRTEIGPSLSGLHTLILHLIGREPAVAGQPLTVASLPAVSSPLVTVNGNTIQLPYAIDRVIDPGPGGAQIEHVVVRGAIPDSFLAGGSGTVRISWAFLGDRWTSTAHFSDPGSAYQAIRTTDKSVLLISKNFAGFTRDPHDPAQALSATSCWQIFASDKPLKMKTAACTSGDAETQPAGENAEGVVLKTAVPDKIVLVDPYGASFPVDVPKLPSSDSGPKPIALNQYDSVWIEIPLEDVSKANSVEADLLKLKFIPKPPTKPDEKSKAIKVELTRELTVKPGNVDITVLDKDGKAVGSARLQIACVECKSSGGK